MNRFDNELGSAAKLAIWILILCFLLALAFPDLCRWVGWIPN